MTIIPKYTVEDVGQRQRFTQQGRKVSFFDISITTDLGATGTLRIASKDYDKTKVKELLDEFAEKLNLPFDL